MRELGVALGPAIGWTDEGLEAIRNRPIVSLQTVFNVLEQEPGRDVRRRAERGRRLGRPHLPRPARVRHAVGQDHARHGVPSAATTARTATATTCSTTSTRPRPLAFLWEGTGRTIGQAAIAGILADPAFTTVLPTCVSVDDVRRVRRGARPRRSRPTRRHGSTSCGQSNFGVTNRYEMPLKSSTGG